MSDELFQKQRKLTEYSIRGHDVLDFIVGIETKITMVWLKCKTGSMDGCGPHLQGPCLARGSSALQLRALFQNVGVQNVQWDLDSDTSDSSNLFQGLQSIGTWMRFMAFLFLFFQFYRYLFQNVIEKKMDKYLMISKETPPNTFSF